MGEERAGSSHVGVTEVEDKQREEANGPAAVAKAWPWHGAASGAHWALCLSSTALMSLQRSLSVPIKESQCPQSSAHNNGLILH